MRRVAFWASVVFLIFLGLSGLQSSLTDWRLVETMGQAVCVLGQATFGGAGLLAGVGAILNRSWARACAMVFALACGMTAGLSSVVWGSADYGTGIASGALGLLLGILLYLGIDGGRGSPAQA
jgi:hypothetical protein